MGRGSHSLGLLLAGNSLLAALAGTGIGTSALTTNGQTVAVTASLVGTNLDLATNVGGDLATKITLDLVVVLDVVTQGDELLVVQLMDAQVTADTGGLESLQGTGVSDSENVGQCDLEALVARQVDSNEACHVASLSSLTTLGEGREGVWRGASSSPVVAVDENGSSDEAPAFVRGWWPRSVLDGFELGPGTCIHVCGS